MLAVFLDRDTLHPNDIDFLPLEAAIHPWVYYGNSSSDSEILDRIQNATVVVTNKAILTGSVIQQASQLQLICIAATGTNNVDLETAHRLGIAVCNVRGYCTASVVEHVFALILSLTRNLTATTQAITTGIWQRSPYFTVPDFPCRELSGKTIGIIGYGDLGRAVARIATAFGMTILVSQRANTPSRPGRIPLKDLLSLVDVLSVHCPLTQETTGLIGREELALMRPNALLINTARGGIVDEQALADALCAGQLGGAGIDVLSQEPPHQGNPLFAPNIPNLILTPHVAWSSHEARQYLVLQVAKNIHSFLASKPCNLVI
ncbi:D-isomer specific 2-hydroxyacid dehydrogenase NAD-binding protein [Candidatus Nitrosoglobus terrae]|uniref:D-isomer specific 2-hydroxyacid dehydrogenase NAD-binding protein n=1 Tax=Candidatus Nitrosoglobus terrae TaxID=1630141 RepID=A0A1Q2SLU9_9GAMM|nr:2-hydroxyacid dehydrogenase [Candidatus Nitrosoglobus terrae]BAW80101.1 D-isomer specific 2-hydroxyacid dehydrogenase NAD-binding protein [Candidatus Nitrosoglobus terrae]